MKSLHFFTLGIGNAWWLSGAFGILNLALIIRYRTKLSDRIFRMPPFTSISGRLLSLINMLIHISIIIYSIFLPLEITTPWFWAGLIIYLIATSLYITAMINYASSDRQLPATKGVYRISRHPMQVMTMIIFLGIGIASTSWIVISGSLAISLLMYPSLIAQERFCVAKYGQTYNKYIGTTPRYLLFI
jgi:protein-S-isoprenylcysteine O-methyltransferase Ste14